MPDSTNSPKQPAKVSELSTLISEPSGQIKSLMEQLSKINSLNKLLSHKLNVKLSQHYRVVNLQNNNLIIAADSPAWANKLRFQTPELLSSFRQSGYLGLSKIEIIVVPKS